ncbi:MAG: hypothetical protein M3Y45_06165 [Actinomycetota bacterium]|nr:hypothetical protein [Actinomycetota bacterium]
MLTNSTLAGSPRTGTLPPLFIALFTALFLAVLLFAPQQSDAAIKRGVFKVKIAGVQTNQWDTNKTPKFECDWYAQGNGREKVRFHTPFRKMRILAVGHKRADSAIFAPIPVRGKVTRKGTYETQTDHLSENCFGDGGDGPAPPPPAPDCGTKPIRSGKLSLWASNGKLTLDRTSTRNSPKDLFRNCAWRGKAWPAMLTRKGNGNDVSTNFSPKWIFNRKFNRKTGAWSKVIMIARGTNTVRHLDGWYKTSIRWTVTMKRLR